MTTALGPSRHGRFDGGADPARARVGQTLARPAGRAGAARAARTIRHDDELVALGAPAGGDHGPEFACLPGIKAARAGREIDRHHGVGPHRIEAGVGGGLLGDGILRTGHQAGGNHEHDGGSHGRSYSGKAGARAGRHGLAADREAARRRRMVEALHDQTVDIGRRHAVGERRAQLAAGRLDQVGRDDDDQLGLLALIGVGLEQRAEDRHVSQPRELGDVLRQRSDAAGRRWRSSGRSPARSWSRPCAW